MSYSTLRRSRTYIVVPRDVDPQNFIYVPETRKVRSVGLGKCLVLPLVVFLVVGSVLGTAGYFLHQYTTTAGLREWPDKSLLGETGETAVRCQKYQHRIAELIAATSNGQVPMWRGRTQIVSIVRSHFHFIKRFIVTLTLLSRPAQSQQRSDRL